jgi:opacity protein-like surface antigen
LTRLSGAGHAAAPEEVRAAMRRGIATAGVLAVLVLLLSGSARAQDEAEKLAEGAAPAKAATPEPDFGRDGFYAGLNMVYAVPYFEDHVENIIVATRASNPNQTCGTCVFLADVDPSVGFNARFGYRFLRHFAIEGQFEWLDQFTIQIKETTTGQGGTDASTIGGYTVTLDAKLYPFTGRFQPFVDLGLGLIDLDSRDNQTIVVSSVAYGPEVNLNDHELVARFGGGLDFYINETWGMNFTASYVTPAATLHHFNYTSLNAGFFYRFGAPERD